MSVTFSIEALGTGTFVAECELGGEIARCASYEGALALVDAHAATCSDCAVYRPFVSEIVDVPDDLDVDLATVNAGMMLGLLGLLDDDGDPADLYGSTSAEDLLGRVLLALAEDRDESALAAQAGVGSGGARWVDCGLREGYVSRTLGRLHELAQQAARLGRDITWA